MKTTHFNYMTTTHLTIIYNHKLSRSNPVCNCTMVTSVIYTIMPDTNEPEMSRLVRVSSCLWLKNKEREQTAVVFNTFWDWIHAWKNWNELKVLNSSEKVTHGFAWAVWTVCWRGFSHVINSHTHKQSLHCDVMKNMCLFMWYFGHWIKV